MQDVITAFAAHLPSLCEVCVLHACNVCAPACDIHVVNVCSVFTLYVRVVSALYA